MAASASLLSAVHASAAEDLPSKKEIQRSIDRIYRYSELTFQRMPEARPGEAELGKLLFFDDRLSAGRRMSCSTCHDPDKAWADGLPTAHPPGKPPLARNTPTVLNAADYALLFWDGRVSRLEEQPMVPLQSPDEMGAKLSDVIEALASVPEYERRFGEVYGSLQAVSAVNVGKALAAFIRGLRSPYDSPFDRFQKDPSAMGASAQRGMVLFAGKARCVKCHFTGLISDHWFHQSAVKPGREPEDLGRYAVVPDDTARWAFRTPSLRNVARTAPYMHDGSLKTLREVVDFYDRGGDTAQSRHPEIRPIGLKEREKEDLVAFLESLSSSLPKVDRPQLPLDPPAGASAPKLPASAAEPPSHNPAENENDEPPFAAPEPGPVEACKGGFSIENLLRGIALGRYPAAAQKRLKDEVLEDAIWQRIHASFAADDAAPCSALKGLRGRAQSGIWPSAEFYCAGMFYELAFIKSFLSGDPDTEPRCELSLDYNYRRLGPGDSKEVCRIILGDYGSDPGVAAARLAPRYVPAYQPANFKFVLDEYAPKDYDKCVAMGDLNLGVPRRCKTFTDSLKARRAGDPALCSGSQMCLSMAGFGALAAEAAAKQVERRACAILSGRDGSPR